jgi:6-pyruvoyltetrahydropterin/6-carboxytetrahydropterin synthase
MEPSISITKQFKFHAAHFLPNYSGLCGAIHGHEYYLEVTFKSPSLIREGQAKGMIVELDDIKKLIQPIIQELDHSLIVEKLVGEEMKTMSGPYKRVVAIDKPPTTEELAMYIWEWVQDRLVIFNMSNPKIWLKTLRLQETSTGWVTIEE